MILATPAVLRRRRRQAGAAIAGVVRDERLETTELAADTPRYTDGARPPLRCGVKAISADLLIDAPVNPRIR